MASPSITIHGQAAISDDRHSHSHQDDGGLSPHALVLPFPVQGHIKPMMLLCKLLAKHHGFTISFLNTESNHKLIMEDVGPVAAAADDDDDDDDDDGNDDGNDDGHDDGHGGIMDKAIRLLCLPDPVLGPEDEHGDEVHPESHLDKHHITLTKAFLSTEREALEALVRAQRRPPVTCLILDFVAPAAAHELGERLGIPRVFFFSASAASLRLGIRSGEVDGDEEMLLSFPLLPIPPHVLEPHDINPYLKVCGKPSDYMCRSFNALAREHVLQEGDTILIDTIEEVEPHSLGELRKKEKPSINVLPIGPLLDDDDDEQGCKHGAAAPPPPPAPPHMSLWKTNYSCQAWLDTHPPRSVLLVSFGSLVSLSPAQLAELGLGFEMSGHRILWVIRPDQIIGTTDSCPPPLPDEFFVRNRARISVVPWLPQLRTLSHPSLAAFFTHCGWNSTLESLSAGVPMLAWPFFGDQMQNARFVVDVWRVGLRLLDPPGRHEDVTRDVVATKIAQLMGDGDIAEGLRQRARDLKRFADMAIAPDGSSSRNLSRLAQLLSKRQVLK